MNIKTINSLKLKEPTYDDSNCGIYEPCFSCGQPIDDLDKASWIHILSDGNIINDDNEIDDGDEFQPLCTKCKIKVPKEFRF